MPLDHPYRGTHHAANSRTVTPAASALRRGPARRSFGHVSRCASVTWPWVTVVAIVVLGSIALAGDLA